MIEECSFDQPISINFPGQFRIKNGQLNTDAVFCDLKMLGTNSFFPIYGVENNLAIFLNYFSIEWEFVPFYIENKSPEPVRSGASLLFPQPNKQEAANERIRKPSALNKFAFNGIFRIK